MKLNCGNKLLLYTSTIDNGLAAKRKVNKKSFLRKKVAKIIINILGISSSFFDDFFTDKYYYRTKMEFLGEMLWSRKPKWWFLLHLSPWQDSRISWTISLWSFQCFCIKTSYHIKTLKHSVLNPLRLELPGLLFHVARQVILWRFLSKVKETTYQTHIQILSCEAEHLAHLCFQYLARFSCNISFTSYPSWYRCRLMHCACNKGN